jgi:hypothetical protein
MSQMVVKKQGVWEGWIVIPSLKSEGTVKPKNGRLIFDDAGVT